MLTASPLTASSCPRITATSSSPFTSPSQPPAPNRPVPASLHTTIEPSRHPASTSRDKEQHDSLFTAFAGAFHSLTTLLASKSNTRTVCSSPALMEKRPPPSTARTQFKISSPASPWSTVAESNCGAGARCLSPFPSLPSHLPSASSSPPNKQLKMFPIAAPEPRPKGPCKDLLPSTLLPLPSLLLLSCYAVLLLLLLLLLTFL
mmetsp:Transcript_40897/g.128789  ORF Transcript_40897/g.128789 Transcript_40897/m.128789 type:complete len:204 (+) Transcript_40897:708-1319(+)